MTRTSLACIALLGVLFMPLQAALAASETEPLVPEFRVFLDPGHGGRPENASSRGGAHWDPLRKRFLNVYRYGAEWRAKKADGGAVISEQAQVLKLAKMVRERLEWTRTEKGWKKFEALLSRYGAVLPPFHRVKFSVAMSRTKDYLTHPATKTKEGRKTVNKYFRIFDCPDKYPYKPGSSLRKGRLSESTAFSPHLQISLHIDGSENPQQRGMSALFVPSPKAFETARQIILGKAKSADIPKLLRRWWSYRGRSRDKLGWLLNDAWTFFTGFGTDSTSRKVRKAAYIGQRWQHLDWAYADPVEAQPRIDLKGPFSGPFFERERAPYETFRRGGGPEEVGGDNLYAGQELLRYIRYAWWKEYAGGKPAWKAKLTPRQFLPSLEHPTGADWAMPLFSNAVAPFLEIGQLWNKYDRFLLTERLPAVADGLVVGIYSLFQGFQVPAVEGVEAPKGLPIDWNHYQLPGGGSYFVASHPRFRQQKIVRAPKGIKKEGKP
jgi:N-acetylmuramoyl-L-alanine amidase